MKLYSTQKLFSYIEIRNKEMTRFKEAPLNMKEQDAKWITDLRRSKSKNCSDKNLLYSYRQNYPLNLTSRKNVKVNGNNYFWILNDSSSFYCLFKNLRWKWILTLRLNNRSDRSITGSDLGLFKRVITHRLYYFLQALFVSRNLNSWRWGLRILPLSVLQFRQPCLNNINSLLFSQF